MRRAWVVPWLGVLAACAGGSRGARPEERALAPGRASPLEVTRAFYRALHEGDAAGAADLVASPAARPATASFVELARAYAELEAALRDRFGPGAAARVGYSERVLAEEAQLGAAEGRIDGDRALVVSGGETLARLRRVDGRWKVELDEALATDAGLDAFAREARLSRRAAARIAPAIRGGLFDVPEDALEAFRNEVEVGSPDDEPPGAPSPPRDVGLTL